MKILCVIFFLGLAHQTIARSNGAPNCGLDRPAGHHGVQDSPARDSDLKSDLKITYVSDDTIEVEISRIGSIKGILLVPNNDGEFVTDNGRFDSSNFKVMDGTDNTYNCVTHTNPSPKTLPIKFTYKLNVDPRVDNIVTPEFNLILVENFTTWWKVKPEKWSRILN